MLSTCLCAGGRVTHCLQPLFSACFPGQVPCGVALSYNLLACSLRNVCHPPYGEGENGDQYVLNTYRLQGPADEKTEIQSRDIIGSRPLACLTPNIVKFAYSSFSEALSAWPICSSDNRRTLLFHEELIQALCGYYSFRLSGLSLWMVRSRLLF